MVSRRNRRLKKLQKKEQQEKEHKKRLIQKVTIYSILIVMISSGTVVVGKGYFESLAERKASGEFPYSNIHWHVPFEINICGQRADTSFIGATTQHAGAAMLHSHGDSVIHIEGSPTYYADVTLGSYFESVGLDISENSILGVDSCNNEPAQLYVYVNGELIDDPLNYSPMDNDSIIFELR